MVNQNTSVDSGWDEGLFDDQRVAASHIGSHARLLAGPGTGKTHTLARRVVYLVTQQSVPPSDILALTFTRIAAYQLRSAIQSQLGPLGYPLPHISTLHSFALRQLLRNADLIDVLPQPLRIADDWEEQNVIHEDIKLLLNRPPSEVRTAFSQLSADWERLSIEESDWRVNYPDPEFLGTWEEHRRIFGYTLRSELVYQLKRALEQVPGFVLESGFQHVLIDEYQDLNPCDLAIAARMADRGGLLVASGDDDQSIYGFRYADPGGIRGFLEQFPGAADLKLVLCRRCGSRILNFALWVAEQDRERIPKELEPAPGQPEGEVHLLSFGRETSEAAGIAQICRRLIDEGTPPDEILILLRSDNRSVFSQPVRVELEALGVQVGSRSDKRAVLEGASGRKFFSLLRIICDGRDHLAWRSRLQLTPGIGITTIQALYEVARRDGLTFFDVLTHVHQYPESIHGQAARAIRAIDDITNLANRFADQEKPGESGLDECGVSSQDLLVDLIRGAAELDVEDPDERSTIVEHLLEVVGTAGVGNLTELIAVMNVGREGLEPELDPQCVNILTMHQAKGLSADVVFIIAAEDEYLPQFEQATDINDDRRLLYVSMTRARTRLYITYSGLRYGRQRYTGRNRGSPGRHLSRFLRNGPIRAESGLDYTAG